MKKLVLAALLTLTLITHSDAHCEVPCGIYGDKTRIDMLYEHTATIEKAMKQIAALAGKTDAQSLNQKVRWIVTKEEHATKVQHIVTQYFMTQRVKPKKANYVPQLKHLHGCLLAAMKCKQSVDAANTKTLRACIDGFAAVYFSPADLEHIRKGHGKHAHDAPKKAPKKGKK